MQEAIEYIFSINTGRAGSHYLATLFSHVSDCRALHEATPIGNGRMLRRFSRGALEPMRKFTRKKVAAIAQSKGDSRLYVETNHCFVKGFGWFIPEYLPIKRIGVVILRRDSQQIANSLLRIGCSPLMPLGRKWISTPDMTAPLVTPPKILISSGMTYRCARFAKLLLLLIQRLACIGQKDWHEPQWLRHYERECLRWYVDETTARGEAFKQRYPEIRYFETKIENLNSLESVQQMFSYFGYCGRESLQDAVGKPTNLKQQQGKSASPPELFSE